MSHSIDERYRVYNERIVRARKLHRCAACDEPIAPGHLYARVFILDPAGYEHPASIVKRCLRCQKIHLTLRQLNDSDEWPDEELDCGETFEEHHRCAPPEELAALAFLTQEEAQRVLASKPGG